MLPFTIEELRKAVADGDVTKRDHPTLPYSIYNYSPEVMFSQHWTPVTKWCRGLILDNDYNIIARPWEKFHNLGQVELPIQFDTPVEVMDKVDGSLGILYPDGEGYAVATRGSFTSDQAIHATKLWNQEYAMYHNFNEVLKQYTYLFEIVYPSNRIVLNYHDMDDLVLLGAVETDTGYYVGPLAASNMLGWMGPVAEVMPHHTLSEALGHMDRKNAEGYVVRSHNFMVKLKQPDYLELHKLVTNASPKTVWEKLAAGMSKSQIIGLFPDEFHTYIESMVDPLLEQYDTRQSQIMEHFAEACNTMTRYGCIDRACFAKIVNKYHKAESKYMFLMYDDRSIRDALWKELRPRATDA